MRAHLLLALTVLGTLTACGDPTCAGQDMPELVEDAFTVTLSNDNGAIIVDFAPTTAAELIVREVDGGDVWHITCNATEDDAHPDCLTTGISIGGEAPAGATLGTPSTSFQTGPSYEVEVRAFDVECEGETRSGKSDAFTVTMG